MNVVQLAAMGRRRHRLHGIEVRNFLRRSEKRRRGFSIIAARCNSELISKLARLQPRPGKQAAERIKNVKFGSLDDIAGR